MEKRSSGPMPNDCLKARVGLATTVNSSALAFALRGLRHRLASKYTSLFLSFINNNKFYHNQNMGGSVHRNLKQASVLLITQSPKINLKLTLVNAWLSFCAIYV